MKNGERSKKLSPRQRETLKKIGEALQIRMVEKNWSLRDLAEACELGRTTVRDVVLGESNVGVLTLTAIVEACGWASLNEFLKEVL